MLHIIKGWFTTLNEKKLLTELQTLSSDKQLDKNKLGLEKVKIFYALFKILKEKDLIVDDLNIIYIDVYYTNNLKLLDKIKLLGNIHSPKEVDNVNLVDYFGTYDDHKLVCNPIIESILNEIEKSFFNGTNQEAYLSRNSFTISSDLTTLYTTFVKYGKNR